MATARKKPAIDDRELSVLNRVLPAFRGLDKRRWNGQTGKYEGGRTAVRSVLAYLNARFPQI